jgi:hypothetical protein
VHPTISEFLIELAQNALDAGATRIEVRLAETAERIEFAVADDGPGMDAETARRAVEPGGTDPAKHPGRRMGLGLPFLKQAAEQAGGRFEIETAPGAGTTVRCAMDATHWDTPPVGDVAGTAAGLFALAAAAPPPPRVLVVERMRGTGGWRIDSAELAAAAGPLATAGAQTLARAWLESQEAALAMTDEHGI